MELPRWGACTALVACLVCATACAAAEEPEISKEPFAGTPNDYNWAVLECLNENGWGAVAVEQADGSIAIEAPDVTTSALQRDFLAQSEKCQATLPPIPEPQTDGDIEKLYETWTDIHACLVADGFDVPLAPTFQTFADQFRAGDAYSAPYYLVPAERAAEAEQRCPKDPDSWW